MKPPTERLTIMQSIRDSAGERVAGELRGLQSIAWTFSANARELTDLLTTTARPPQAFALWSVDNRALFDEFYDEVLRLLHNFLASVKSLVDHTRHYVNAEYADHPFRTEYQSRVDSVFAHCAEARFVQQLREYVLHRSILPTTASLSGKANQPNTIRSRVLLNVTELRSWGGWTGSTMAYVQQLPDTVDILEIVAAYEQRVRAFYDWFSSRLAEIHEPELSELQRLYDLLEDQGSV